MKGLLLISLVVGAMVGSIIIYTQPSTTSYSIVNYGRDGLSKLREAYEALVVTDLNNIARNTDPLNTAYLIIRSSDVSPSDADVITQLVAHGGYVIISGSPEFVKSLSRYAGLNLTITNRTIYDMIYNGGDRLHPRGFSRYCGNTFITYKPYYVLLGTSEAIAYSSNFSYVDLNSNGYMDIEEPLGSFPLATSIDLGKGRLILVFSPQVFTNELFESNKDFIDCIVSNRKLVIDQTEIRGDFIEYLRVVVSTHGVSYLALIFIVFILCVVAYYVLKER